jgi:enoyl-CoA hydratase
MPVPAFATVLVDKHANGVVEVRLNRPAERNAVDRVMHQELSGLLRWIEDEPDVGAVLITGMGKSFCAGGSMSFFDELIDDDWRRTIRALDMGAALVREFLAVRPPVVAAVNGAAVGLGATLALLSDIIVMAEQATISDPHVRMGVVAGDGGTLLWPGRVGMARAKEFLLTGDPVDSATALQIGLVNRVVPGPDLHGAAMEWANRLAGGARQAIAFTKQAMNAALLREAASQMPLAIALEARTFTQPDVAEGVAAFRERRAPQWPSSAAESGANGGPGA